MKHFKLCSVIGLSSMLLFGCGGSDDETIDPPTEPPVEPPVLTVNIDQTETLTASLQSVDAENGTVTVKLTGDDDLSVTDASAFNLIIMGYPSKTQSSTKYNLDWHQASHANCIEAETCSLDINEAESGLYYLTLDSVNWKTAVETYRVALEVKGDKAHYELVFMD
ncbi:hypothetical protein [Shewanella sp. UCD-KL21]|uniref:hypothetical protein n=1 Tax=Shewanella sp. UCD-KL21 TaxID=1917164 RepID=UPI000970FAE8|nr:hypothetical protein [Shewanella sp. UCD-KL21]